MVKVLRVGLYASDTSPSKEGLIEFDGCLTLKEMEKIALDELMPCLEKTEPQNKIQQQIGTGNLWRLPQFFDSL